MEYNFSGISVTALEDIDKKLRKIKIKLNVLDDVNNFIRVLNNPQVIEQSGQITQEISDIFNDEINKSAILYTECLNKVQKVLRTYL